MNNVTLPRQTYKLSVVIPCYNEEKTLRECCMRVLKIAHEHLQLEIIIVDDGSTDRSMEFAQELKTEYPSISVISHGKNQGKGAALHTGFQHATGDFVAVQDADLEYDPNDFLKLLPPLLEDKADVVLGSRFLSEGPHRILYFWHSLRNKFLTFLSNIFTDLNLTDMETCYKVFRREVIQKITIEEKRFGFEPEIVAKMAHKRLRIYEAGISYDGRTYSEGKKIGIRDGFRALYCIFKYNASKAPLPIQFIIYTFIGSIAALFNLILFMILYKSNIDIPVAAPLAFVSAACINYLLCILFLFRHKAKWPTMIEILIYFLVVAVLGFLDLKITEIGIRFGTTVIKAKLIATFFGFLFNFLGRKYFVFHEPATKPW